MLKSNYLIINRKAQPFDRMRVAGRAAVFLGESGSVLDHGVLKLDESVYTALYCDAVRNMTLVLDFGEYQRVVTLLLVLVGWVIFSNTDFAAMRVYLGNLVGIGTNGFADAAFWYHLRSNLLLLALGGICATPVVRKRMVQRMYDQPVVATVTSAALFLLSTAFLVYGSYNPFLYFRV